ncbi:hypothetical protein G647_06199 [Cladophialophora carrionii CBS 160.54]|uniref:Clr5 domain-containing protein n=1 Tax=Cladophialophora carrionii CBS 160.54 TaxID=1279043 RepID=V9D820_9EURO|nr:uncharacterized protein G647_06199 [Cladophialophora carrionii CBS 160.54]ETI22127.1 hypothetical protein G647_06199 [Cladophialophora carrionii CBS 160.54]
MRDKTLDFDLTPESATTPDSVADELDALHLTINMQRLDVLGEARAQYPQEEQDWDKVKDVITRLYQDEGLTLVELQRNLLKHHNFKATTKQWKSRITRWGLSKNNRQHEAEAVLLKKQARKVQGKETKFSVRGRNVDIARIQRYAKRKRLDLSSIDEASSPIVRAMQTIRWQTPSPQPGLLNDASRHSMRLFDSIAAFVDGTLGEGHPLAGEIWRNTPFNADKARAPFMSSIHSAQHFQDLERYDLAFLFWRRAFRALEGVIQTWNRATITYLLRRMRVLEWKGNADVLRRFRAYINQYAVVAFSKQDPRFTLIKALAETDTTSLSVSNCVLDQLVFRGGEWQDLAFEERTFVDALELEHDANLPVDEFVAGIEEADRRFGYHDSRTCRCVLDRTRVLSKRGYHNRAERFAYGMLQRANGLADPGARHCYRFYGFIWMALSQYELGKFDEAEFNALEALRSNEEFAKINNTRASASEYFWELLELLQKLAEQDGNKQKEAIWKGRLQEVEDEVVAEDKQANPDFYRKQRH